MKVQLKWSIKEGYQHCKRLRHDIVSCVKEKPCPCEPRAFPFEKSRSGITLSYEFLFTFFFFF